MPRPTYSAARLALATAGVLALATAAQGQYRVEQDGGALDANPRLGSGGSNTAGRPVNNGYGAYDNPYVSGTYGAYGNNVVTGNVTGGRQFRGSVGYGDPRAFRDGTAGAEFDAFNRSASGVTTGGQLINYADAGSSRPFFGDNTVANPPADFVRTPGSGGFVPSVSAGASAEINRPSDYALGSDPTVRNLTGNADQSPLTRLFSGGALDVDSATPANDAEQPQDRATAPEALLLGGRLTGSSTDRSLADVGGRTLSPYTRLGRDNRLSGLTGDRIRALGGELLRDEQGNAVGDDEVDALLQAPGGKAVDATANPADGATGLDRIEQAVNVNDRMLRLADPAEQSARVRPTAASARPLQGRPVQRTVTASRWQGTAERRRRTRRWAQQPAGSRPGRARA